MTWVGQVLVMLLGAVIPLTAQDAAKVRRPGGGGGIDYKAYDAATLDRGKTAFAGQCGFCHGSNARGGENGPDLIRSPLVRNDEDGNLIAPVILNGRPAARMPKFNMPGRKSRRSRRFCMRVSARRLSAALTNF